MPKLAPTKSSWSLTYRRPNDTAVYHADILDPKTLIESLSQNAKTFPDRQEEIQRSLSSFQGKANSFRTSCGFTTGHAYLLVTYSVAKHIREITQAQNEITLTIDDGAAQTNINRLVLFTFKTITHLPSPGNNFLIPHDDTPTLIHLVDFRWVANYSPNIHGTVWQDDNDQNPDYYFYASKNRPTLNENGKFSTEASDTPQFIQAFYNPANPNPFAQSYNQQLFNRLARRSWAHATSAFGLEAYPQFPSETFPEQFLLQGRTAYQSLVALTNHYGFVVAPDYLNSPSSLTMYTTEAVKPNYTNYDNFADVTHLVLDQQLDTTEYFLPSFINVHYSKYTHSNEFTDQTYTVRINTYEFPTPSNSVRIATNPPTTWEGDNASSVDLYSHLTKHENDASQVMQTEAEFRANVWLNNQAYASRSMMVFGGFQRLPLNKQWQAICFYDIGTGPKTVYYGTTPPNFHQNLTVNDLTCDVVYTAQQETPTLTSPQSYAFNFDRFQQDSWKDKNIVWKRGGGVVIGNVSLLSGQTQLEPYARCWFKPLEFFISSENKTLKDTLTHYSNDRPVEIAYWVHSEYVFGQGSAGTNQTSRAVAYWSDTAKAWIVFDLLANWEGSDPETDPPTDPEDDPPTTPDDPPTDPPTDPPIGDDPQLPPDDDVDFPRSASTGIF